MRACLLTLAVIVTACAQPLDTEKKEASLTGFWRSQPKIVNADIQLEAGVSVKLLNKETNMPHLIDRDLQRLAPFTKEDRLDKLDLEFIGQAAASEIFPNADLRQTSVRQGRVFSYVSFQQYHSDRPVVGADLTIQITGAGDWSSVTSNVYDLSGISQNFASRSEAPLPKFLSESVEIVSEKPVIYPRKELDEKFHFYPAREFQVSDPIANTGFILWVHDETGEVLGDFNPEHGVSERQIYGSILPNNIDDEELWVPLPFMEIKTRTERFHSDMFGKFNFQDLRGERVEIRLTNPFLTVVNNRGLDNGGAVEITEEFLQAGPSLSFNENSTLEERNIFFWVMKAREYLEQNLDFHEMNYQIIAMARDGIKLDNAYFNPVFRVLGKPVLGFGEGDTFFKNTALSRDIILHEFGHAVTHQIYGIKNSYEFSAMNEAFSDYFAATITGDPIIAEGMFLDPKRTHLRRLDNKMLYPQDFKGDYFHSDGQIFSGALWQLRERLGAEMADSMIHEARLSKATTIVGFYVALLKIAEALDDRNEFTSSDLRTTLRKSFRHHGLHTQARFTQPEQEDLTIPWTSCWSTVASSKE